MVSCSFSLSFLVGMLCFVLFIVVVVDKREEKSSPIHMIVLFSLCGFCKFMTRSHTHPNWEHLHLIYFRKNQHITQAKWNHGWGWEWKYSSPGSTLSFSDMILFIHWWKDFVLFLFFVWKWLFFR
jgi:hypothetical protein